MVYQSNVDNYKVVGENNNTVSLRIRKCSWWRWEVYSLPCKYASEAIMQTNASVSHYINHYFTIDSYRHAYAEPIYSILDYKKANYDKHELCMWLPITKKRKDPDIRKGRGSNCMH